MFVKIIIPTYNIKIYTLNEAQDKIIGKVGTPQRDSFENKLNKELISNSLTRQNLNKCIELAEQYGFSKMTKEEITDEVKAVRQNVKNRN